MAVDPQITAILAEFDTATNAIAVRIQRIIDTGTLSADSRAALQQEIAKLNLLGQDPTNPIPTNVVSGQALNLDYRGLDPNKPDYSNPALQGGQHRV